MANKHQKAIISYDGNKGIEPLIELLREHKRVKVVGLGVFEVVKHKRKLYSLPLKKVVAQEYDVVKLKVSRVFKDKVIAK